MDEREEAPRHETNSESSKAETVKGRILNKDINDPLFIFPVNFSETSSETIPSVKLESVEDQIEAEAEAEVERSKSISKAPTPII